MFPTLCNQTFSWFAFPPGENEGVCKKEGKAMLKITVLRWVGQLRSTALQESWTKNIITIWIFSRISIIIIYLFIIIIGVDHYHHGLSSTSWSCTIKTCAFGKELWMEEPSRLAPSLPKIDCILFCNAPLWVSFLFIYFRYKVQISPEVECGALTIKTALWKYGHIANFVTYITVRLSWYYILQLTGKMRTDSSNTKLLQALLCNRSASA